MQLASKNANLRLTSKSYHEMTKVDGYNHNFGKKIKFRTTILVCGHVILSSNANCQGKFPLYPEVNASINSMKAKKGKLTSSHNTYILSYTPASIHFPQD